MATPTVIDLFAGAGGFSLGFTLSGYSTLMALESDTWAADTLRYNKKTQCVIEADIRDFTTPLAIKQVMSQIPDVIIGGPPCQGFSVAGPAKKDPNDPRNSLFINFVQWVATLTPQIFVMENVKGLLSRKNANGEQVINIIRNAFETHGYSIEIWVLNAADYGVPQMRERIFIVGNCSGKALGCPPPTHTQTSSSTQMAFFEQPAYLQFYAPKPVNCIASIFLLL